MVRVREEMFPGDCMHPACTLLVKRRILWEIIEDATKITIPSYPDLVSKFLKGLAAGEFVIITVPKKFGISELEVLGSDG